MAQELITTFRDDLGAVTLVPGTGGIFEIRLGDELIWERKRDGGFPESPRSSGWCATGSTRTGRSATSTGDAGCRARFGRFC